MTDDKTGNLKQKILAVVCAVICAAFAVFSLLFSAGLVQYYDRLELVFRETPYELSERVEELKIREITEYAILERYNQVFVSDPSGVRSAQVALYTAGPELWAVMPPGMLHGNFLTKQNPAFRQGYAVIGAELASELFSYTDCVGNTIYLNGSPYEVIGVTAERDALTGIFGSTERHAVYLYAEDVAYGNNTGSAYFGRAGRTSLVVACRENTAGMVLSRLSAAGLGADAEINHDANARFAVFLARLMLLAALCLPLYALIRALIPRFRPAAALLNSSFILPACAALALAVCAVILFAGLQFAMDPRLIPQSLADVGGVLEKLRAWFTLANNGATSGGSYGPALNVQAWAAWICAGAAMIAARGVIKRLPELC